MLYGHYFSSLYFHVGPYSLNAPEKGKYRYHENIVINNKFYI